MSKIITTPKSKGNKGPQTNSLYIQTQELIEQSGNRIQYTNPDVIDLTMIDFARTEKLCRSIRIGSMVSLRKKPESNLCKTNEVPTQSVSNSAKRHVAENNENCRSKKAMVDVPQQSETPSTSSRIAASDKPVKETTSTVECPSNSLVQAIPESNIPSKSTSQADKTKTRVRVLKKKRTKKSRVNSSSSESSSEHHNSRKRVRKNRHLSDKTSADEKSKAKKVTSRLNKTTSECPGNSLEQAVPSASNSLGKAGPNNSNMDLRIPDIRGYFQSKGSFYGKLFDNMMRISKKKFDPKEIETDSSEEFLFASKKRAALYDKATKTFRDKKSDEPEIPKNTQNANQKAGQAAANNANTKIGPAGNTNSLNKVPVESESCLNQPSTSSGQTRTLRGKRTIKYCHESESSNEDLFTGSKITSAKRKCGNIPESELPQCTNQVGLNAHEQVEPAEESSILKGPTVEEKTKEKGDPSTSGTFSEQLISSQTLEKTKEAGSAKSSKNIKKRKTTKIQRKQTVSKVQKKESRHKK